MRCLQLSSNHRTVRDNHHSHCRYYIRSALPFGSPVNTNFHLLRMVRYHGSRTDVLPPRCVYSATVQPFSRASGSQILAESFWVIGGGMPRHGFPNKEDDTSQRSPAWKPYLYKGKSKLTLCHGLYFFVMLLQISWTSAGLTPKRSFITGISPNWFKISWNGRAWFGFLNDYWWRYHLKNERVRYATMHSYLIYASEKFQIILNLYTRHSSYCTLQWPPATQYFAARSVVETINCTLYGKSEYEDDPCIERLLDASVMLWRYARRLKVAAWATQLALLAPGKSCLLLNMCS